MKNQHLQASDLVNILLALTGALLPSGSLGLTKEEFEYNSKIQIKILEVINLF